MQHDLRVEVDRNYDFFQRNLSGFLKDHAGQYALLKSASVVAFHDGPGDAYRAGLAQFCDRIFSIQKVTDEVEDLGFMSLALV
jgi:hypothetical protein